MTDDKIEAMKKRINELSSGDPTPLEIVKLIGMTEMLSIATGKRYKITRDGLREERTVMTDKEKLTEIKKIIERALKADDAINQFKANSITEIADILEIKITESEAKDPVKDKDQITIDDILKEV